MTRSLTLVLGGARSGKTTFAQQLAARQPGPVLYVATAEAGDDEMAERIAAHRADRLAAWATLEAPLNVGAAIQQVARAPAVVVLDCLTLLANNVIVPLAEPVSQAAADAALLAEIDALLAAYQSGTAQWIVVSNEVGLGLVPAYPLGRVYRDALGRANQRVAAAADNVLFMVAGLPLVVKGRGPD